MRENHDADLFELDPSRHDRRRGSVAKCGGRETWSLHHPVCHFLSFFLFYEFIMFVCLFDCLKQYSDLFFKYCC